MSDMSSTIIPKSDQLNFDDFVDGKDKSIKITNVTVKAGEQPVSIFYEGDNGKPWKPCKSMCKVLVRGWGIDSNAYVGRMITLYGDSTVSWGGMAVGGIRISHMSHVDKGFTMALTASKSNRKPFTVKAFSEKVHKMMDDIAKAGISAKITTAQQSALIALIKTNKISPSTFLQEFGIDKSDQLPADKYDSALAWIDATVTAANKANKA